MSDLLPEKEKVICSTCGKQVDKDEKCPHCGSPLDLQPDIYSPSSEKMPEITKSTFSVQDGTPTDLQDIRQKLNILWEERKAKKGIAPPTLLLPQHVEELIPEEVAKIVHDVQRCYEQNIPDACPGLLRKALTSAIKIKFLMKKQKDDLYDKKGNRKADLYGWIDKAKQRGYLTQELAKQLKRAKMFGDIGAHDEMIDFDNAEVAEIFQLLRYAFEHMYKKN